MNNTLNATETRKDYKANITLESVNQIINFANDKGLQVDIFEGTLLDNYVIYDTSTIDIGRTKGRKYIILREKVLNCWSSITELIMTDNDEFVNDFVGKFEFEIEYKGF
jgi:hypothetical protein